MMNNKYLQEIIKCKKDFSYFCSKYVKVYHPTRGTVSFNLYDFQKRVFKDYENHRFNIIRKFRQGGLSTMTAIYCLWRCLFFVDKSAFVVSISDREAMNFHKIVRTAFSNLPEWMSGEPLVENQHELILETGGSVVCFTPKAGRGFAKGLLVVDEAAFIPEMDDFWARVYPTISTGGKAIVISTVNGMGNWYHQTWVGAESGTNKFHPIMLNYIEHPDYQDPKWVEDTKAQLGEKKWRQEVLAEFLGSANTYINGDLVKEYVENSKSPIEEKLEGCLRVWKQPQPGKLYILGCDPSEGIGEDGDFSAIQVVDASNLEQCAEFYSQDYPPRKFAQICAALGRKYNKGCLVVESNNFGHSVLDSLYNDIAYENIYSTPGDPVTGKGKSRMGWMSGKKTRNMLQEKLYHIFSNKLATIYSKRLANELQTWVYNSRNHKAQHLKGYYDDAIMAFGLALEAREQVLRNAPPYFAEQNKIDLDQEMLSTYIKDDSLIEEIVDGSDDVELVPLEPDFQISREGEDILKEFGW